MLPPSPMVAEAYTRLIGSGSAGLGQWKEAMSISLEAAAQAYRDAMRETVQRFSLWYLIEGVLLVVAGILAVVFPVVSSAAAVIMLGWLLIVSGIVQGISLIG